MIVGVLLMLMIMAVAWGADMMFGPGHMADEDEWTEGNDDGDY